MNTNPVSMITIASEQLLPQLEAAVHFFSDCALGSTLHIIYTDDLRRSQTPAKLLARLLKMKFQQLEVKLAKKPIRPLPKEMVELVEQIMNSADPNTHWIMNVTGGTKLMSAVLMEKAGQKNITVVYRELSQNTWYKINRDVAGNLITASEKLTISENPLSIYSVSELLQTQLTILGNKKFDLKAGSILELDFVKFMELQIKHKGEFSRTFQELGMPSQKQGFAFEMFIYNMVKSFGLDVVGSVLLSGEDGGQQLQEIDIIVNNGYRLIFIDCKLRAEDEEGSRVEKLTSQIRQAAITRNEFGGLGAEMILLRPNRTFTENEKELCQLYKLKFIESSQTVNLMPILYNLCTGRESSSMSAELCELQKKVEIAYAQNDSVFFQKTHLPAKKMIDDEVACFDLNFFFKKTELIDFIHNFTGVIGSDLNDLDKKWSLSCLQSGLFFLIARLADSASRQSERIIFSERCLPIKILYKNDSNNIQFALFRLTNSAHIYQEKLIQFFQENKKNYLVVV